jgi:hypothetical protein
MTALQPSTDETTTAPATEPTGDIQSSVREDLLSYADLGGFTLTPKTHAWYAAADTIANSEEARAASTALAELRGRDLPATRETAARLLAETTLGELKTAAALADAVTLLHRVRATLTTLTPAIYTSAEVEAFAAATADGAWRKEHGVKLSWGQRRALRRDLRVFVVTPGTRRAALHTALVGAAADRKAWAALSPAGTLPSLPEDSAILDSAAQAIDAAQTGLRELDRLLPEYDLATMPFDELSDLVDQLAADEGTLYRLPTLRSLRDGIEQRGHGELLAELTGRHADADAVAAACDQHFPAHTETLQSLLPNPREDGDAAAPAPSATPKADPTATHPEPEATPLAPAPEPPAKVKPEAEATAEAEPKAETTTEVEPKAEAEVEPKAEATAEIEPKAEATAEVETTSEAEATAEIAGKAEVEAKATSEAEATAAAEVKTELTPEAEPEVAVKPEVTAEPTAKVDAEPKPEADSAPQVDTETEAELTPEVEPTSEIVAEPTAEAEPEVAVKVEPTAEVAKPQVEAEPKLAPEVEPIAQVEAEPTAELGAEPTAAVEADADTEADAEADVAAATAVVAEPQATTPDPEPTAPAVAEALPEAIADVEPESKPEAKAEPEVTPEAAAAPEAASAPAPGAKPRRAARPRKPDVTPGSPVNTYSADELLSVVRWIDTDGTERTDDELLRAAMKELGFSRLGPRIKEALGAAVASARS